MTDDNLAISDLTLERYHLNELPPGERARVDMAAAADADVRTRLAALAHSDAEIHASGLVSRLVQSAEATKPYLQVRRWSLVATAAVLVIAAAWLIPRAPVTGEDRIKGDDVSLLLYRKTETGSELLDDGATVRSGDVIRVAYRAGAPCFGVIVSIDGAGVVTRHLPTAEPGAAAMRAGDATPLDQAYELDHAPKFERFYLITGVRAFDVDTVLDAARRVATTSDPAVSTTLPLPSGLTQSTFLLRKGS